MKKIKEEIIKSLENKIGCGKTYILKGNRYVCGSYYDKLLCKECYTIKLRQIKKKNGN